VCHLQGVCQAVSSAAPNCRTPSLPVPKVAGSGRVCPRCATLTCANTYTPTTGVNGCPPCRQCQTCPKYKCVPLTECTVDEQETPLGANNCRLCPRCKPKSGCTVDSDCQGGSYCSPLQQCLAYLNSGDHCALTSNSARCNAGFDCIDGQCKCAIPKCPVLTCGKDQETRTLSNGCPGCNYCIIFT